MFSLLGNKKATKIKDIQDKLQDATYSGAKACARNTELENQISQLKRNEESLMDSLAHALADADTKQAVIIRLDGMVESLAAINNDLRSQLISNTANLSSRYEEAIDSIVNDYTAIHQGKVDEIARLEKLVTSLRQRLLEAGQ